MTKFYGILFVVFASLVILGGWVFNFDNKITVSVVVPVFNSEEYLN